MHRQAGVEAMLEKLSQRTGLQYEDVSDFFLSRSRAGQPCLSDYFKKTSSLAVVRTSLISSGPILALALIGGALAGSASPGIGGIGLATAFALAEIALAGCQENQWVGSKIRAAKKKLPASDTPEIDYGPA